MDGLWSIRSFTSANKLFEALTTNQKVGTGVGILALASSILLIPPPPAQKTITLAWDKMDSNPSTITEIWSSTNLISWTLKTNVAGTNHVTLPATNKQEFFKARNNLNGQVSDWARKTN